MRFLFLDVVVVVVVGDRKLQRYVTQGGHRIFTMRYEGRWVVQNLQICVTYFLNGSLVESKSLIAV